MEKTKSIVDSLIETDQNWHELQNYILNIEAYCKENKDPGGAIGQCKVLMEAIFKTIIKECGEKGMDSKRRFNLLQNTFDQASNVLKLEESHKNVIKPFCKFINETRNKLDGNAHSKDIKTLNKNKTAMSDAETHFWIALTDNIASYILDCYKKLMTYNENEVLNDWLDESGGKPTGDKSNSWILFKNEPEKYSLFAELKNSQEYAKTTRIVEKFEEGKYQFSDIEIKVLRKIYVSNSQVHGPVQHYPTWHKNHLIKEFFKQHILKNKDLFTKDELNEFLKLFKT